MTVMRIITTIISQEINIGKLIGNLKYVNDKQTSNRCF